MFDAAAMTNLTWCVPTEAVASSPPKAGKITRGFAGALREHNLRASMGHDASRQPGDLQELMLHETAVAWTNGRLTHTAPQK